MLHELADHRDATEPEPFAGPDHPIRQLTRKMAFGAEWRPDHGERMAKLFDEMATEWGTRRAPEISDAPIVDAVARGELPLDGRWLELGSGAGAGARALGPHVANMICTDISSGMLTEAPAAPPKTRSDASRLPFASDTFDGIMMINMILFPGEVDRVLAPAGTVLWANTLGDQTPIHLPAADVLKALPGDWQGTTARAGQGFWLAARRR